MFVSLPQKRDMSTTKITREEALARLKRSQARKKERLAEMEVILRKRFLERTGEEPKYFFAL